ALRFVYDACAARGVAPIIPLRETANVKRGHHRPPGCDHGTWTFAGADFKRKRAKWRCPTGACSPGWAAPLGALALEVGSGERPGSVVAPGRAMVAALDVGRLAQRNDGRDAAGRAGVIDEAQG